MARREGNKGVRPKLSRARDQAMVAELHLKGLSFQQIADELNNRREVSYEVTTNMVNSDYRTNIKNWNKQALTPTGADIQQQLQRLRYVEVEAWAEWEKSKDPAETIRTVKSMQDITNADGEVIDQVLAVEKVEELIKGQVGDERFLRVILDAWDKRARLLGQYTTKVQIDANIKEEKEVTFKMYKGASPMMWDDETVEVIDGQIVKNGQPINIVDGKAQLVKGDG